MTIRTSRANDRATTPTRKHEDDAGMDLYYSGEDINIRPFRSVILTTDVRVEIPHNHVGIVEDKSRNDFIIIGRVIDPSYQGTIDVKVVNFHDEPLGFKHGQAIAQLVIYPCLLDPIKDVPDDELFNYYSPRGATGGIVSQRLGEDVV